MGLSLFIAKGILMFDMFISYMKILLWMLPREDKSMCFRIDEGTKYLFPVEDITILPLVIVFVLLSSFGIWGVCYVFECFKSHSKQLL
ncbi:MAG: hypothetical protein ACJAWW_001606 [Sulfurimonas sp.]|jgi:hypothetical protein